MRMWLTQALLVVDLLVIILMCVGLSHVKPASGIEPWSLTVYRISQYEYVNQKIHDLAADMSGIHRPKTIEGTNNLVVKFSKDVGTNKEGPVVESCLIHTALDHFEKLLDDAETKELDIRDEEDLLVRDLWACVHNHGTRFYMTNETRIDVLMLVFIWTIHAFTCRALSNDAMQKTDEAVLDKKSEEGEKWEWWSLARGLALFAFATEATVFIYTTVEAFRNYGGKVTGDFSFGASLLMGISTAFAFYAVQNIYANKVHYDMSYIPKNKPAPNAANDRKLRIGWITLSFIKPMLVTPVSVLVVFGLCGITEYIVLLVVFLQCFALAIISSIFSYYNLYVSARDAAAPKVQYLLTRNRPKNLMLCYMLLSFTLMYCFSAAPSHSSAIFFNPTIGMLLVLYILGTLVLPDVLLYVKFDAAMNMKEITETFLRLACVLIVTAYLV